MENDINYNIQYTINIIHWLYRYHISIYSLTKSLGKLNGNFIELINSLRRELVKIDNIS